MKVKYYLDNQEINDFTQIWTNRIIFEQILEIDVPKSTDFFICRPWIPPFEYIEKNLKGKNHKIILWIVDGEPDIFIKDSRFYNNLKVLSETEDMFIVSPNYNINNIKLPFQVHYTYSMADCIVEQQKWNTKLFKWLFKNSKDYYRQKYFLSYNGVPKYHRLALFNNIIKNNILDKFYISMASHIEGGKNTIPEFDMTEFGENFYNKNFPLHLDIPESPAMLGTSQMNPTVYFNSYIGVITASGVLSDSVYVDEKVYKPFASFKPFILIGECKTLKFLKEWGFKTFSPFIDESYDDIKDYDDRMKIVYSEILRISNMTIEEIDELYWNMEDILVYNFSHLSKFVHNVDNDLTKKIIKSYD